MTSRQPPESLDDDEQIKRLQALHKAQNGTTPAYKKPVPKAEQNEPRLVTSEEVELDRIEAYLRGPTAFTA
ncbi:hypothetical protein AAII07_53110 [Microvirga sp. 0TCS3.31]